MKYVEYMPPSTHLPVHRSRTKMFVKKCDARGHLGSICTNEWRRAGRFYVALLSDAAERRTDKRLIGHRGVIPVYHD